MSHMKREPEECRFKVGDVVEVMVKVNDALNDLPSLVEKVYKASHSNYKSEEILLASAHVLISDMNILPEIRVSKCNNLYSFRYIMTNKTNL